MMSVPRPMVSAMPCTMYCDSGNMGALSFTSNTFTISCHTTFHNSYKAVQTLTVQIHYETGSYYSL